MRFPMIVRNRVVPIAHHHRQCPCSEAHRRKSLPALPRQNIHYLIHTRHDVLDEGAETRVGSYMEIGVTEREGGGAKLAPWNLGAKFLPGRQPRIERNFPFRDDMRREFFLHRERTKSRGMAKWRSERYMINLKCMNQGRRDHLECGPLSPQRTRLPYAGMGGACP
jgi:hypothetical protein